MAQKTLSVVLLNGIALALSLSPAVAAEIDDAQFDWTGPYAGIQAGYLLGDVSVSDRNGAGLVVVRSSPDIKGIIGGVHAGYNKQFNNVLVGLEGDLNLSNASSGGLKSVVDANNGLPVPGFGTSVTFDWEASLRARAGVPINDVLPYVTGGVALARPIIFENFVADSALTENLRVGWTVGAGLEFAASDNFTVRAEYRYANYGHHKTNNFPKFPMVSQDISLDSHLVTVGVSFKF